MVAEELASCGATLKIPLFLQKEDALPLVLKFYKMSGKEVHISRKISNVRMQVKRAIGRLRKFMILQSNIPITQIKLLNDVMIIIAGLVNLNNSAVSK